MSDIVLATSKDIALLNQSQAVTSSTSNHLAMLAMDFHDAGVQQHINYLASLLFEESCHLRSIAEGKLLTLKEQQDKESGESEDASHDFLFAHYDQREVQDRGADNIKWYNPHTEIGDTTGSTRLTKKRGICFHHTAVKGGFGTHSSRRDYWANQGLSWSPAVPQPNGKTAPGIWRSQPSGNMNGVRWQDLNEQQQTDAWVRAMALADRYRGYVPQDYNNGVPYQVISGPNSVLYYNLPFDWVTYHGNGANTHYLGYAWDAKSTVDTFNPDDLLRDIKQTIHDGKEEGHFQDGLEFTMHCVYTNKPDDVGKVFAEFLVDIAEECDATIRMDYKAHPSYKSFNEVLAA